MNRHNEGAKSHFFIFRVLKVPSTNNFLWVCWFWKVNFISPDPKRNSSMFDLWNFHKYWTTHKICFAYLVKEPRRKNNLEHFQILWTALFWLCTYNFINLTNYYFFKTGVSGTISWKIGNGDCAVVMFSLPYDFNLGYSNWMSVGIMKESKNLDI